jgi:ribosome-associated toxin RatA of RatAB toxin-antitoxin module
MLIGQNNMVPISRQVFFKMATIETEIIIGRSPEQVRAVMLDFASYPKWNSYIQEISVLKGEVNDINNCELSLSVSLVDPKKAMG